MRSAWLPCTAVVLSLALIPGCASLFGPSKPQPVPLTLHYVKLIGSIKAQSGDTPIPNARWYVAQKDNDGMSYRFPMGQLAAGKYLTADMLLDGNILSAFEIRLQEGEKGPVFGMRYKLLNQCQARVRFPLEAVNMNRWQLGRDGAVLKPLCHGSRVDLKKVDRMSFIVERKGEAPTRWCMTDFTLTDQEVPALTDPILPKGPLLDELGQSTLHQWPAKSRSREEVTERLKTQLADAPNAKWPENYSQWGGWKERRVEATGFFHTYNDGKRWWLVDPEGYLFWSSGLDCVTTGTLSASYGRINRALTWLPEATGMYAAASGGGSGRGGGGRGGGRGSPGGAPGAAASAPAATPGAGSTPPAAVPPPAPVATGAPAPSTVAPAIAAQTGESAPAAAPVAAAPGPASAAQAASPAIPAQTLPAGPAVAGAVPGGAAQPGPGGPPAGGRGGGRGGPRGDINYFVANCIRAFGAENWRANWVAIAAAQFRQFGFNTVANWSDVEVARKGGYCYITGIGMRLRGTPNVFRDFPDVFSESFASAMAEAGAQPSARKDDPALLGYFLMNEPTWGFADVTVAEGMMFNSEHCASRKALADWLRKKYGDDKELAAAWKMPVTLDAVGDGKWEERFGDEAKSDLTEFSTIMVDKLFRSLSESCKKADPNHMNLGARYYTVPPDWALKGMTCFDVFSVNAYGWTIPAEQYNRVAELTKCPVIVGEYHFGALDVGLPATGLGHAANQTERGKAFRRYLETAAACPSCVGVHYFHLYDQSALGRSDGENYQIGFVDICSRPYEELVQAARISHERLYQVVAGELAPYNELPKYLRTVH